MAGVIVPVSIERTASASSSVSDSATGMQDADSDLPPASTNPALSFSVTASSVSTLVGWTASSSASTGTVGLNEQGSNGYIQLTAYSTASVSNNTIRCATCAASASSSTSLAFTFDLVAPIHVYSFLTGSPVTSISMLRGGELIRFGGQLGSLPFDMAPGRYTLVGSTSISAAISGLETTQQTRGAMLLGVASYTLAPEPSSGLLLSAGLLAVAAGRRSAGARRP